MDTAIVGKGLDLIKLFQKVKAAKTKEDFEQLKQIINDALVVAFTSMGIGTVAAALSFDLVSLLQLGVPILLAMIAIYVHVRAI